MKFNTTPVIRFSIISKLVFLICAQFSCMASSAQEENVEVKYFDVINDVPVQKFNLLLDKPEENSAVMIVSNRQRFALIKEEKDYVVIRFIKWSSRQDKVNQYRDSVIYTIGNIPVFGNEYFALSKTYFISSCVRMYPKGFSSIKFALGFVTMPVKLRLGNNFDFEPTISLGATAGVKMRISRHYPNYINLLFSASTSTINLDSFSTKGKINETIKNIFVFSSAVGLVVEFSKSQVGLFYGRDFLGKSNNVKYDWIYNKSPWITLGFGFTIFSLEDKAPPKKEG